MKRYNLFLLLFFSCNLLSGQKHDNLWLFGYNTNPPATDRSGNVVDFSIEPPLTYKQDRQMNLDVTVASMCDSLGNLLFYTNGAWIANFTHEMMENGDSLNPGQITWNNYESGLGVLQSAIVLPYPNHPGKYFLFHLKLDYDDVVVLARNTFYYTSIDMTENNSLGKVIQKNQKLLSDEILGTLSAIKHANGRDWWIIVSDSYYYRYKIFFLSPFGISYVGEQDFGPTPERVNGNLIFSPDGTKMAQYEVPLDSVVFYDFDRCTGTISNPEIIPLPDVSLGAGQAFSPNGRFFYMASSDFILQVDLWADDIPGSLDTVAVYDGFLSPFPTTFFASQLGPDGRIYITTNNGSDVLHYINQPNRKGDSCQVVQHGLKLAARNRFTSPHFPNFRLGPLDGSPCDTLGLDNHPLAGFTWEADTLDPLLVQFTDNSFYEPTDWLWDFGGTGGSTEADPQHTFPTDGTYTVCLTVSNQYDSDTFCREVTVSDLNADFSFEPEQLAVQFTDLSTSQPNAWRWDFGDGDTSILQNPLHVYAGAGIYDVCLRASDEFGSDVTCREVDVVVSGTGEVNRDRTGVLTLVPNPASGLVTGYLPQTIDGGSVILTDNMGRTQLTVELAADRTSGFKLDLRNLNLGVYHCLVRSTDGRIFTQKLIVQ